MQRRIFDEAAKDIDIEEYVTQDYKKFGVTISYLHTKGCGSYYILYCAHLHVLGGVVKNYIKNILKTKLKKLMLMRGVPNDARILVVGLGNDNILADSLGKFVTNNLYVDGALGGKIYAFNPSVLAMTGINSYDVVRLLVKEYKIGAIILVDSLLTKNIGRLACSIQLNSYGITPGSGVHGLGKEMSAATLGIPCFAVGVPLMTEVSGKVLTPKDVHSVLDRLSEIIAGALNDLFKR